MTMDAPAQINGATLDKFRNLLQRQTGILITPKKDYLLASKIGKMLRASDHPTPEALYRDLQEGRPAQWENLVNVMTTNHTFFFRESNHLKILCQDILAKKLKHPLIWVAASSTGEEVYSIIIELLEGGVENFTVVASDIKKEVLLHMKRGVYHQRRFHEVAPQIHKKYFLDVHGSDGTHFRVKDHLKGYFVAKVLNLMDPLQFESPFDYVFCRNALIYFDKPTQKAVVSTLCRNLKDYGYLFVGHTESLMNVTDEVESVFSSVYSKKL